MGLLGVIMEVTFQCEPKFNLEETITIPPVDEGIDNLGELAHSAEHVKFWLELCSQSCAYYQTNCTKDEPRNRPQTLLNTLKASHSHITIIMHLQYYLLPFTECVAGVCHQYSVILVTRFFWFQIISLSSARQRSL